MKSLLVRVVLLLILIFFPLTSSSREKIKEDQRLIRRVFLDIKCVPPSPAELNWYLCYNHDPYLAAINWCTEDISLRKYLMSDKYKQIPPVKLNQKMLDLIIKYQCGNVNLTTQEADVLLIELATKEGLNDVVDTIDHMAICLMARSTNTTEINELLKIFKTQPNEKNGYLAVLNQLKTYTDYTCK
jgi:hypothetical protein